MDLARFDSRKPADDGVDFELLDEAGEVVLGRDGKPITFRLGHWDGPRTRAAVRAKRKQRDGERQKAGTTEITEDDRERDIVDDLAAMTIGWSDNFDLDGKPCVFSHETAASLYYRSPHIANQMGSRAAERVNFMSRTAKP